MTFHVVFACHVPVCVIVIFPGIFVYFFKYSGKMILQSDDTIGAFQREFKYAFSQEKHARARANAKFRPTFERFVAI